MKKMVIAIGLMFVVITQSISEEIYGNVGVALASSNDGTYKNGGALVATAGLKLDRVLPHLVVEGEGSYTLIGLKQIFNENTPQKYSVDVNILNLGLYAGYLIKLHYSDITIKPRIGLNYANIDRADQSNTKQEVRLSFGVGGFYPLNDTTNLFLDVTDKGNNNNYTAGVQISF